MRATSVVAGGMVASIVACVFLACATKEPTPSTYFDRTIAPILQSTCVRTNTGAGCHVADAKGNAFGNLDLTTFAGIDRRRDLLLDYGPYLKPSLLVKNVPPYQVTMQLWDGTTVPITTDIKHTGLSIFDPTGGAYETIHRWIENGATEQNTGVPPISIPRKPCTDVVPSAAGFDPTTDPVRADFGVFQQSAGSILATSCAAGNCHGTAVNALYLTCGQTPEEVRWNYHAASLYLATTPAQSEIVRRPLASSQGGSYHEGGPIFASVMDPSYQALSTWAASWVASGPPPEWQGLDPAFLFFAQRVQPVLVKKGCMMAQCHSAAMFHDYRLRGGSAGSFSLATSLKNYALTVGQMSFESDDVNGSRLVRKNLYRPEVYAGSTGIAHRGGPLFEDFGGADAGGGLATGAACDQGGYDYDGGSIDSIPAYCIVREWHRRERAERNLAAISAVVYVQRPPPSGPDRPQDFDLFAGGASLHLATVTAAPGGSLTLGADARVDLTSCGLDADPDVRRPAVSWDGATIAFAARSTATDPLAVYTMNSDGTGCAKEPTIAAHDPTGNGLLEHDFDPAFSPPGPDGVQRIVFASTRGNLDPSPFSYSGPQLTPEDLSKPNANLYVREPDPAGSGMMSVRQLTWQLNMERMPSFMQDGRLVFTVEKREPNFYQLALRRQNLDGGDYHPLYAQRASIGYTQATYVAELSHKDFVTIFSNADAVHGAGSLAVFNRSIGIDFASNDPADYPIDPGVIDAELRVVDRVELLPPLAPGRGDRRLLHEPVAAPRRQGPRELRRGRPVDLRRRLRPLRPRPFHDAKDQAPRRRRNGGGRGRRGVPARAEGHLHVGAGRAERTHGDPRGRSERRRDRPRHDGPRVAPVPEHAHGPRGRARSRELRDLRGSPARPDGGRLRGQRRDRRVRAALRSATAGRDGAGPRRRIRALSRAGWDALFDSPGRRRGVPNDGPSALAARGDDLPPRRVCAPVFPGHVLRQPVRGVPRLPQRAPGRPGSEPRFSHPGVERHGDGGGGERPDRPPR